MISKKAKKGILYGALGGIAGFVVAVVLLFVSFIFLFGWWGKPQFFPIQILKVGSIIAILILGLSIILKIKKFGILTSIVIFLATYIETLRISTMLKLPVNANKTPIFCLVVLLAPFLIWLMLIIAAVKKGVSVVSKNDEQK